MMRTALCLALLCALACEDSSDAPDAVHATLAPIALERHLVFVDGDAERAYVLDVGTPRPAADARRVTLAPGAALAEPRAGEDHDEALVLCSGERGSREVEAEPATLIAIDGAGKSRNYELGTTPFNALTQSQDGRYAVLYQRGQDGGRTLSNPNELVVVDLDKQPDEEGAVTGKTPDGLGHPLSSVLISPMLRIAEEDRRLLVVLSAAEVTLFDLHHLDRRATIVQLDETRAVNPVQVLFDSSNPQLFVRAQNSDNIFMFRFEKQTNEGGNDFRPTINLISGGAGPRDIALFGTGSDARLLVVAETSAQALVVDPSTSKSVALKLSAPAEKIVLFDARSPADNTSRTRALLYSTKLNSVTFLDLNDLNDSPEDKLELMPVVNLVRGVIPLLDEQEVVLLHERGVSLLALAERTLTPILSSQPLSADPVFDPAHKRLWIAPTGQTWVGTLDLATGKTDEILMDAAIGGLVPMLSAERLVVLHSSGIGYVTLLDLERPSRDSALSLRGFYVSGSLDRGL
jgi:hypothetical protein